MDYKGLSSSSGILACNKCAAWFFGCLLQLAASQKQLQIERTGWKLGIDIDTDWSNDLPKVVEKRIMEFKTYNERPQDEGYLIALSGSFSHRTFWKCLPFVASYCSENLMILPIFNLYLMWSHIKVYKHSIRVLIASSVTEQVRYEEQFKDRKVKRWIWFFSFYPIHCWYPEIVTALSLIENRYVQRARLWYIGYHNLSVAGNSLWYTWR